MNMTLTTLLVLCCATLVLGQRPTFAGSRPIGYPEVTTDGLGDRFGEVDGTTQRLPIEANGDRDLVDRLSKLPIDKQPFWFINWQAYEANRQKPQTYPQKPNGFVDPLTNNVGSNGANFNSGTTNSNTGSSSQNFNSNAGTSGTNNRFGNPDNTNLKPSNSASSSTEFVNSGNENTTPTTTVSGFISGNRFGAEEYPRNKDRFDQYEFSYYGNTDKKLTLGKHTPLKDTKKY